MLQLTLGCPIVDPLIPSLNDPLQTSNLELFLQKLELSI